MSYVLAGTELISQNRGGAVSYYLKDGQGSTRTLVNASGSILNTYGYHAFGDFYLPQTAGITPNNYLYTGQQYDSLTGNYSLRARHYDPTNGRFLSRDKYDYNFENPIELNRYIYAINNPILLIDPFGLMAYDYGKVTFERTKDSEKMRAAYLRAFFKDGKMLTQAEIRAIGQRLATQARLLSRNIRANLAVKGLPQHMRNVTIAVGETEGTTVYAVNSSASPTVVRMIQQMTGSRVVQIAGLHAETALMKAYPTLTVIAISNSTGPCPACQSVVEVPVFFLGRLFIALIAGR